MEYTYRTAGLGDIKDLQQLTLRAYGQFQPILTTDNWQRWKQSFESDRTFVNLLNTGTCFVCEAMGKIVGMAFLIPQGNPFFVFEKEWAYIRLVGVDPQHADNGIGKALTRQCIDLARASGETTLALHTSEFQEAARHIYESLGFQKQRALELVDGKQYYLYTLQLV